MRDLGCRYWKPERPLFAEHPSHVREWLHPSALWQVARFLLGKPIHR